MNIHKIIGKLFFKGGGWVSFIINTGLIFLIKSAITKKFEWWALLLSVAVSFFLFYITNYISIQSKYNLSDNSIRINFDTETNLSIIKEHVILYEYYRNTLASMIKNSQTINMNSKLELDPYQIYSHIIFATENFKKGIFSLDCDINAWYYICEEEDFETVAKLVSESEKEHINITKESYLKDFEERRRIDLTYNISHILVNREENNELSGIGCIKRIFILEKEKLDIKTMVILAALERINGSTRKRICNHYIFMDELDTKTKNIVKELQDIIIFDDAIAYQEYTLKDSTGISTILTDEKEVKKQIARYKSIWNISKPVNTETVNSKVNNRGE